MYLLPWIYLTVLIISIVLLFCSVFAIIIFTDLECDYINPIEACNGLNKLSSPELIVSIGMAVLLGLFGNWASFIWIMIFLGYCIKQKLKNYTYDPTTIYTHLDMGKKVSFIKLGYHLLSFLLFLCLLISSIVD